LLPAAAIAAAARTRQLRLPVWKKVGRRSGHAVSIRDGLWAVLRAVGGDLLPPGPPGAGRGLHSGDDGLLHYQHRRRVASHRRADDDRAPVGHDYAPRLRLRPRRPDLRRRGGGQQDHPLRSGNEEARRHGLRHVAAPHRAGIRRRRAALHLGRHVGLQHGVDRALRRRHRRRRERR